MTDNRERLQQRPAKPWPVPPSALARELSRKKPGRRPMPPDALRETPSAPTLNQEQKSCIQNHQLSISAVRQPDAWNDSPYHRECRTSHKQGDAQGPMPCHDKGCSRARLPRRSSEHALNNALDATWYYVCEEARMGERSPPSLIPKYNFRTACYAQPLRNATREPPPETTPSTAAPRLSACHDRLVEQSEHNMTTHRSTCIAPRL